MAVNNDERIVLQTDRRGGNYDPELRKQLNQESKSLFQKWRSEMQSNGKFDYSECLFNLLEGMGEPVEEMIENYKLTIGGTALIAAVSAFIPEITAGLAVYNGISGAADASDASAEIAALYKQGKYDEAEKVFKKIGKSLFAMGTSASALKGRVSHGVDLKKRSQLEFVFNKIFNILPFADDAAAFSSAISSSKDDTQDSSNQNAEGNFFTDTVKIFETLNSPEYWLNNF